MFLTVSNLESIRMHGLQCRALEDVAGSGVTHSKLPEAVWATKTIDQVRRHMMSKDTIDRHVSNNLTTYAPLHLVAHHLRGHPLAPARPIRVFVGEALEDDGQVVREPLDETTRHGRDLEGRDLRFLRFEHAPGAGNVLSVRAFPRRE